MVWKVILTVLLVCLSVSCVYSSVLTNPGFEKVDASGNLVGWQVHTGLDPNRYGNPDYQQHFDMIIPAQAVGGRSGSEFCAGFPREGAWLGRIWEHHRGRDSAGKTVDGVTFGKAALTQTVMLDPGTYVFGAYLRTAGGAAWSGSFSLGYNMGKPATYANNGSTGIKWTAHNLAVRNSPHGTGGLAERGEWLAYRTEPFTIDKRSEVTVWIRFNYSNNHDMHTRWQVDDAFIEPFTSAARTTTPPVRVKPTAGSPLVFPLPGQYVAACGDDDEKYLVSDQGSTFREKIHTRIFQRARCVKDGASFTYEFPIDPKQEVVYLAFEHLGPSKVTIGGRVVRTDPDAEDVLQSKEYTLTDRSLWRTGKLSAKFESPVPGKELSVMWIEAGCTTRFRERLKYVEWDTVSVPWRIGLWDAESSEFRGTERTCIIGKTDYTTLNGSDIRVEWDMKPKPGHRYFILLGYFNGRSEKPKAYINIGDDDVVEYISQIERHEVLELDITDYLKDGRNVASVQSDAIDFVALIETLPGVTDNRKLGMYFGGDEMAANFTRVLHNSMFWTLDLHYDDTGFVDASIPRGKWWNQYWPIDIGMAMRSILFWGYLDQAENIARFVARMSWKEGHESNRSGGLDNTGGNILITDMCEIILRRGFEPGVTNALWPRLSDYGDYICDEVDKSPFGMIKGTNWENAGNLQQGPCYAISTNLLAAWYLMKAADTAEEGGLSGDVDRWRANAARIRHEVLTRLVFQEDVTSPTGWVFPKGTWAYGLLDDGSYMLKPLAGYIWAGRLCSSYYGMIDPDKELRRIYSLTEDAALPAVGGREGLISGYASSYDGEQTLLSSAAYSDKTEYMSRMIPYLKAQVDYEHDRGSTMAELSRWAYGQPGWAEDTNLVCVAEFLDWPRFITGVDDILFEQAQLRIVPRLPTQWNECGVNDLLVQYLRNGKRDMTRLSFNYQLAGKVGTMKLKTDDPVSGMKVRLGPFPKGSQIASLTIDGRSIRGNTETSGDGDWVWVQLNSGTRWQTIRAEMK